ncbi:hypothetical protein CHUUTOTORO_02360 [Serratia phage vB_SmaM-ChuuTotoro]|nr:hypothetical protein CHUUTOTORO_02360 [Serratia phage vB_SmaM-ChuuTotoro]
MQIIQSSRGNVTIVANKQDVIITNSNGVVTVNGIEIVEEKSSVKLTIKIDGDAGNVTLNGSGDVEVWQSAKGDVKTQSGDVKVLGYVNGDVSTMSGDVDTNEVWGSVSTMSGDITHK